MSAGGRVPEGATEPLYLSRLGALRGVSQRTTGDRPTESRVVSLSRGIGTKTLHTGQGEGGDEDQSRVGT